MRETYHRTAYYTSEELDNILCDVAVQTYLLHTPITLGVKHPPVGYFDEKNSLTCVLFNSKDDLDLFATLIG